MLDAALGGARRRLDIDRAPAASQPASTAMKAVTASKDGTLHVDYNKPFHFSNCHDARGEDVCRRLSCNKPDVRRYFSATCNTCGRLVAPVQIAWLHDGYLPIPENSNLVFLEIGSSDRNTMDAELLPQLPNAFLVTAEPLLDKYARALGRRRPASRVHDALEPLGQHHDRGFALPVAVAPISGDGDGELREFRVGPNSGCSSLLQPNRSRHKLHRGHTFGVWCDSVGKGAWAMGRQVHTVPLRKLLSWIGRPVDFVKIDAQGMDLEVVKSGGDQLKNVKRLLLEVIADDCRPVYEGQPTCTEVFAQMRAFGFTPLTPIPCKPPIGRGPRANHRCELEVVFINTRMGVSPSDGSEVEKQIYYEHHQAHLNWCTGTYALTPHGYGQHGIQCAVPGCDGGLSPTSTLGGLFKTQKVVPLPPALWRWDGLPPGVVLVGASAPQSQGNQLPAYYAREWMDDKRWRKHADGRPYVCPISCTLPDGSANKTHMLGIPWANVFRERLQCPFW